jgi:4-alpha-glucanotransferase
VNFFECIGEKLGAVEVKVRKKLARVGGSGERIGTVDSRQGIGP